jgi:anthranilate synthase/aminodeoxychorismate synthase-like glutamine amidotransferase
VILLIDNYDSFTFNIFQYLSQIVGKGGPQVKVVRNDRITVSKISKLKPQALIFSPGPGKPDEAGVTLEAIASFAGEIPMCGVCLGHQAIGQAFGAKIVRADVPMHGKLSTITHRGKGVFRGVPSPLLVTRYHSLVIAKDSLPSCLKITAETEDGLIMGVRHRRHLIEGVQFHPESYATQGGMQMLANFLGEALGKTVTT